MSRAVVIPSPEEISGLDAAGLEAALIAIERARRQIEGLPSRTTRMPS